MSEDRKKNLRLQGRFSNKEQFSEKSREKEKHLESKSHRERKEKNVYPESFNSNKSRRRKTDEPVNKEPEMSVQYQENSTYDFPELLPKKKARELKFSAFYILSETEIGTSRIYYDPEFLPEDEASKLMSDLRDQTKWNEKNNIIRGREVPQPRLVAWYGPFPYAYSGALLEAAEMPTNILELKEKLEQRLRKISIDIKLNSVLLNLYRDGKDSVAWHSDDELSMGISPTIVSVSLGEVRKFEMRRKVRDREISTDAEVCYLNLKHGSFLIMDGVMQKDWEHRVPKEFHDKSPRINLTFRTVFPLNQSFPEVSLKAALDRKEPFKSTVLEEKSLFNKNIHDDQHFPPLKTSVNDDHNRMLVKNDTVSTSAGSLKSKENVKDEECVYAQNNTCSENETLSDTNKNLSSDDYNTRNMNGEYLEGNMQSECDEESISSGEVEFNLNKNLNSGLNSDSVELQNDHFITFTDGGECDDSAENNIILEPQDKIAEGSCWVPNVEAPVFVPSFSFDIIQSKSNSFQHLSLKRLINYDYNELCGEELMVFSFTLRDRILENMNTFHLAFGEKNCLDTFCQITDESQSERNQKLILKAMCEVVRKTTRQQNRDHQSNYRSQKYDNYRSYQRESSRNYKNSSYAPYKY